MKNALVRSLLAALALFVGAWLVVGYRNAHLEQNGEDALTALRAHKLSPERGREGLRALHDAQFLNADQRPRVNEGNLSLFLGRPARAAAIAKELTVKEPENIGGWALTYLIARGPAKSAALRRVSQLDPWTGDALR
jgi:hypothetical protein